MQATGQAGPATSATEQMKREVSDWPYSFRRMWLPPPLSLPLHVGGPVLREVCQKCRLGASLIQILNPCKRRFQIEW